ncbi:MAG: hypothetical protein ACU84J_07835 [Gammaproteobacteria bacterium]
MNFLKYIVLCGALGICGASVADSYSNVVINGQRLTVPQLQQLQRQLGYAVVPGNYLYNPYNQCWANLSNGQSGCVGGSSTSRYGSGEWDGRGNWSYRSDYGGSVGGSSDGCLYAGDWSNC